MRLNMRFLILAVLAAALLGFLGCSDDLGAPAEPVQGGNDPGKQLDVTTTDGITRYEGLIGGENIYAILVPENWNGELVVYAHGFVDAAEPLVLPNKDNVDEIRDAVVAMGFAWTYCSYRENGLAVKDGAWATRQLTKIFPARVKAAPTRTWLMGNSLGGLIAVELAETHAAEFDGLVVLNGMIGGTKAQLDYVGHVRVLFDLFYPGVLPGTVIDVPESFDLEQDIIYPVIQAVQTDPTGLGVISRLKQTLLPGRTPDELVQSLITALAFNFRGIHDVLDRTGGACPIDNADTVYEAAAPDLLPAEVLAMVNAYVQRYDRPLPTEILFEQHYEPTGELTIPMQTVHNRYDPLVHVFQESLYAGKVAVAGAGPLLEQLVIERYAHTDFPADEAAAEAAQALTDLRARALAAKAPVAIR